MEDLRYPIGQFTPKGEPLTPQERADFIERIALLPGELRAAVAHLDEAQLATPYRDGGWSPRQIAHHIPDSHLNGFVRFKLALTVNVPTIQPYDQEAWAELGDVRGTPVEASVALTEGLHERWVELLRSMTPQDFGRALAHPEVGEIDLDYLLALYAWHGRHHVTQIVELRQRQGW